MICSRIKVNMFFLEDDICYTYDIQILYKQLCE